jgi:hypothetical protein
MVPSPLRPWGQEQAQLLVRAAALPRPSTAVWLDGQSFFWTTTCIFWTMSWSHRAGRVSA